MMPGYGNRPDGTPKGLGYFGELRRPDGDISTELSVGVNLDGSETEIPTLVPTLSLAEIQELLSGQRPSDAIVGKAADHARRRMTAGLPAFATLSDLLPVQRDPLFMSNYARRLRGR